MVHNRLLKEYRELCGSKEVLVMSAVGKCVSLRHGGERRSDTPPTHTSRHRWESVGGDIKFLRLMQRGLGGLVTDGSVRDTDEVRRPQRKPPRRVSRLSPRRFSTTGSRASATARRRVRAR